MPTSVAGPRVPHQHAHHGGSAPRAHTSPRQLSPWSLIERRSIGLLRYARARGTMALPVVYAIWDRRLVIRLPEYNDACHFIDRADVALDVDGSTDGGLGHARVSGLALLVPGESVPVEIHRALDQWPTDTSTRFAVIVPESVHWLAAIDDSRFPPLPMPPSRLPETFAG